MSKERIGELEKKLEKIERKLAIQEGVKKAIDNEKAGIFKSLLFFIRITTALIVLSAAGDQAMGYNWIKALIK